MAGIPLCNHHMHLSAIGHASRGSPSSAWKFGCSSPLGVRSLDCRARGSSSTRLLYGRKATVRVLAAQSQDEGLTAVPKQFFLGFASSLGITKDISRTQAYSIWLQGGVVLVILAAVDAAFSGDWSRIGILSKETELGLRPLLGLLGLFHIACGSVTALDATQKGYNPVPQTLKVLAVGFLATVEQLYKDPAE